jgi:hypothetical protein
MTTIFLFLLFAPSPPFPLPFEPLLLVPTTVALDLVGSREAAWSVSEVLEEERDRDLSTAGGLCLARFEGGGEWSMSTGSGWESLLIGGGEASWWGEDAGREREPGEGMMGGWPRESRFLFELLFADDKGAIEDWLLPAVAVVVFVSLALFVALILLAVVELFLPRPPPAFFFPSPLPPPLPLPLAAALVWADGVLW